MHIPAVKPAGNVEQRIIFRSYSPYFGEYSLTESRKKRGVYGHMNEETAWGHFAATGSVADYLSYCQARKEEEARALGNGRPGDPGKAGGGKRPAGDDSHPS